MLGGNTIHAPLNVIPIWMKTDPARGIPQGVISRCLNSPIGQEDHPVWPLIDRHRWRLMNMDDLLTVVRDADPFEVELDVWLGRILSVLASWNPSRDTPPSNHEVTKRTTDLARQFEDKGWSHGAAFSLFRSAD